MRTHPLHLVLLRAGVWQFRCNSGAQSFNENSWLQLRVQKSNMVSECTVHTNNADTTTSTQTGQQAARKTRKRKIETDERMGACKGSVLWRKIALATGLQARTRFRSCSTEHCAAQRPSTHRPSLNCSIVFVNSFFLTPRVCKVGFSWIDYTIGRWAEVSTQK